MQWYICSPFYFKVAIDNLEFCCMDPDMEHHYKELLQQWKIDEDNIKDELKKLCTDVKEIGTNIKEYDLDIKEVGSEVKEIGTNIKECDTSIKEVSNDVKEIGSEVKNLTKKLDDFVASTMIPASSEGA